MRWFNWLCSFFKGSSKKTCRDYTRERLAYHKSKGHRARTCHGDYLGEGFSKFKGYNNHIWCEYLVDDTRIRQWVVDDRAVGYKGPRTTDYNLTSWIENGQIGTS